MISDFIWPFLPPYMGVIPNPKMAFIFPISCILALIFPIFMKYFPKCSGKGCFPKSQIKLKPWPFSLENCIDISFIVRQSIVHHFTLTSVLLLLITLSLIFIGRLGIFIARALTHLSRISLVYNSYRFLYTYFDNI